MAKPDKIYYRVPYSEVADDKDFISIERVTTSQVDHFAPQFARVLRAAYQERFVFDLELTDADAINKLFEPGALARRMRAYMASGSAYWGARSFSLKDRVVGVGKISPSRPGPLAKARLVRPNAYVNDINVTPSAQRRGVGSALLHTMLGDFAASKHVVLDGFVGNEVTNNWFRKLGFESESTLEEPFELGSPEYQVPQVRFEAVAAGGVIQALELRNPWLVTGQIA